MYDEYLLSQINLTIEVLRVIPKNNLKRLQVEDLLITLIMEFKPKILNKGE